jgi:hypothetical protein
VCTCGLKAEVSTATTRKARFHRDALANQEEAVHRASISLPRARQISKHHHPGQNLDTYKRADVQKFCDRESHGLSRQQWLAPSVHLYVTCTTWRRLLLNTAQSERETPRANCMTTCLHGAGSKGLWLSENLACMSTEPSSKFVVQHISRSKATVNSHMLLHRQRVARL